MWFRFKFKNPGETIPRWEPQVETPPKKKYHRGNKRVTDLEMITELSDDDVLLIVDKSENKSCQVTLQQLRDFIKS